MEVNSVLENAKYKRQNRRMETLQKRYDKLEEAYDALKSEKADLEHELILCKAKLDRTGKYEAELRETLANAREAKRAYDAAYMELQSLRKQYSDQVNALIEEIKGTKA